MIDTRQITCDSGEFSYPVYKYKRIPINNAENKEVVVINIPYSEMECFNSYTRYDFNEVQDSSKILTKLVSFVNDYLDRYLKLGLEKRLQYSYDKLVKKI
jgi:hypothetical protein